MNREQMIEKAGRAISEHYGWEGYGGAGERVLDAILPQVSTVEELEALPSHTALMGEWLGVPSFYYWHPKSRRIVGYSGDPYWPEVVLAVGPLTVVWQP